MLFFYFIVLLMSSFLIHNIVCYMNKRVINAIKKDNFIIIDNAFYKLQLVTSCLNYITVLIAIYMLHYFKAKQYDVMTYAVIFWGFNHSLRYIAIKKKYAKIQ